MKNRKMDFRGPIHFDDLTSDHPNVKADFPSKKDKVSGIYIFGFMLNQDHEFHKGKERPERGELRFIPYYVGMDGNLNRFKRIREHRNLYDQATPKLIRFSLEFLKEFYLGLNQIPISHTNVKGDAYNRAMLNWITSTPKKQKITYCNFFESMKTIYGEDLLVCRKDFAETKRLKINIKNKKAEELVADCFNTAFQNNSISDYRLKQPRGWVKGKYPFKFFADPLPDSLEYLWSTLNNFWVCYCPVDNYKLKDLGLTLEDLETATFFALKGLTVSTVKSSIELEKLKAIIISCPDAPIFKDSVQYQDALKLLYDKGSLPPDLCATKDIFPGY